MRRNQEIMASYGARVFKEKKDFSRLLGDKPFLSLPVKDMPTKSLKRKARKFNRKFKDQIDWSADGKTKYNFD